MDKRVKIGITALDVMLGGGLYEGAACIVKGAPGTGKTTLALQFLANGIENGEPGLYITFEEFSKSLYRDARSIGIDLEAYERDGKLAMIFTTPEVFLGMLRKPNGEFDETVLKYGVKRAVVDAFNHIESVTDDEPKRMRSLAYSMVNGLRRHNITSMLLQEDRLFLGDVGGLEYGLPYIVETIIQLKYVELEARVRKAILVLKHRASRHSNEIVEYTVNNKGYQIGSLYEADHVISGSAVRRPTVEGLVDYLSAAGASVDVSVRLIEETLLKMGDSLPEENYPDIESFFAAIEKGEASISKLESNPVARENGIYATEVCPFRTTTFEMIERNDEAFEQLTELYKKKYPNRAVVHPFCVCHQNVRERILNKTFIGGKPLESTTLVCKCRMMGEISYGADALAQNGISREEASDMLGRDVCLYTLKVQDS